MKPINFPQVNFTFTKPKEMTDAECQSLEVYRGVNEIVSCWELTPDDKMNALFFGKVWMHIAGTVQPPVWLYSAKTVFEDEPLPEDGFMLKFLTRKANQFIEESGANFQTEQDKTALRHFLIDFFGFLVFGKMISEVEKDMEAQDETQV